MNRLRALDQYSPTPIPIPVHLFAAREGPNPDAWRGWDALLPKKRIVRTDVEGSHSTMVSPPFVHGLGEALSRVLEEVGRPI